jgi:hypothetical protein
MEGKSTFLFESNQQEMQNATNKFKYVNIIRMSGIIPEEGKSMTLDLKEYIKKYDESDIKIFDDKLLHNEYLYLDDNDIDYSWFKKQYDFLLGLSEFEIKVLREYTDKYGYITAKLVERNLENNQSIFRIIHSVQSYTALFNTLFGIDSSKLSPQEMYKYLVLYYNTLLKVIQKAPKIEKQTRLFRGITTPSIYQRKEDDTFEFKGRISGDQFNLKKSNGLMSSSYNTVVATAAFTNSRGHGKKYANNNCCVLEVILNPGVSAIWLSPLSYFHPTTGYEKGVKDRDNTEREVLVFNDNSKNTTISGVKVKSILEPINQPENETMFYSVFEVTISPSQQKDNLYLPERIPLRQVLDQYNTQPSFSESASIKSQQGTARRKRRTVRKRKTYRKKSKK